MLQSCIFLGPVLIVAASFHLKSEGDLTLAGGQLEFEDKNNGSLEYGASKMPDQLCPEVGKMIHQINLY